MAATIAWNGHGNVDPADSLTGWSALKISGTGGGPTAAVADGQIEGTGSVTCVASKQRVILYFDIGAGNELDFTGGGAVEGQNVYIWAQFLAGALLQSQSAGGFGVFMSALAPTTTQYSMWYMEGNDTYDGGWKRFIVDPTSTISASAGTAIDLTAVRYFGVFADVGVATLRFDNLICDSIDVGTGLTVTGTSTTDDLIGDLLTDEATNRYGVVTEKLGAAGSAIAAELAGILTLGDDVGVAATTLTDVDAKFFAANPRYYDGASVANSVPVGSFGVKCVGNATGATSITIGKKVGTGDTAGGRNGWSLIGNDNYEMNVDWDDGNVNANLWYGCSFENLLGTLSWGTNTAHECIGNSFSGCNQFDPVGGVIVRDCTFSALADIAGTNQASLLWPAILANGDIKNCNFAANDIAGANVGHDIEVPTAGSVSFSGLVTAGAEQEILFSAATGDLTVANAAGANFSVTAADHTVTGTGSITVTNDIEVTFKKMKDNSEVRVYKTSDDSVVDGIEDATAGSLDDRTFAWTAPAALGVYYIIHNFQETGVVYKTIRVEGFVVPNNDASIDIQQVINRNVVN